MSTVELVENTPEKILPGGGGVGGKENGELYLEPNSPEVIEMRGGINFTRLPQDPPSTDDIPLQSNGSVVKQGVPMIIAPTGNSKL